MDNTRGTSPCYTSAQLTHAASLSTAPDCKDFFVRTVKLAYAATPSVVQDAIKMPQHDGDHAIAKAVSFKRCNIQAPVRWEACLALGMSPVAVAKHVVTGTAVCNNYNSEPHTLSRSPIITLTASLTWCYQQVPVRNMGPASAIASFLSEVRACAGYGAGGSTEQQLPHTQPNLSCDNHSHRVCNQAGAVQCWLCEPQHGRQPRAQGSQGKQATRAVGQDDSSSGSISSHSGGCYKHACHRTSTQA